MQYQFKMDKNRELELDMPEGVFTPTGTSKVLVKAVGEFVKLPGKLLDLGCGCGVVGISLQQLGLIKDSLYVSDLSKKAVDCAKANAKQYNCPIVAKCGPLFEPWKEEKFDYIVDDVSGVSEEVAKISPWFDNVPCNSGTDGTELIVRVIKEACRHLNPFGKLFFPIVSFSNVDKILKVAHQNFSQVKRLAHEEWPLPREMNQHIVLLKKMQEKGIIQITEKFGMILWFTDVYVAYNA
ncbi:MAG TPA: methyltransferase [Gammaproteobacteria bacterium]|nr:methyltransferase [Gammaproteobacteria bacterium]